MKANEAPEIGDLVTLKIAVRLVEENRKLFIPGIVIETRGIACRILWPDIGEDTIWRNRHKLEIVNEDR